MTLTLFSDAFSNMNPIPALYTCDSQDITPPLKWDNAPANTKSFALVMDDPDAPDPKSPKMTWVHWLIYNIPSDVQELPSGVTQENLPPGALLGLNDWHATAYGGACPPIGEHRYFFKLYALDTMLEAVRGMTKPQLESAMHGHILEQTTLVGTYQKARYSH